MFGSYFTTGYASNNNNKSSTTFSSVDHKNINSSNNITSSGTNSFLVQQQASQQHQHKAVNSLFASSRLSDKKESSEGYRFTESSKQTEVKPTSNDSLTRSNLTRQGSYELRKSINFIAPHSDEKMRNSFLSQKNACSAKHLKCHSPTSTAMFFPKSELIPKTFQKKIHEGNIWLGPKSISISNSNRSKPGKGYLSPTSRNSNIGLLGQNKFRSKHDQNSILRASLPSQQYMSNTQEYEHEKEKQNSIFNESEIGEKMSQEKENDQYYFSQIAKKTPSAYDESNFLKQACSNSNSDINRNSLRISSEKRINIVQHFEQKGETNVRKSGDSHIQTNQISNMKTTQESNLSDAPQSQESTNKNYGSSKIQQQFPQSKSKNLQQLLKTTDQQYQSTKLTYGCYLKHEMPSLPYYSTADPAIVKQTQSQQQVNSSSSPSEHINDILVSAETSSSKSSEHLLHPMIAKRFTTEQASTTKRPPPSQGSFNSHNIYSLQDSFFSPQNQNSEREENHYFSKEPTNVDSIRGSFQKHAQNTQPLAGSIVNVKKQKKKQDDAQTLLLKSQQQDLNVVLMSSVSQGQSNSSHPTAESKHIEFDGDLHMEIQNLRRTNAVLTLKTESLQKEKKHFRDIASRKTEECEHLSEQIIYLKAQLESLKASRINSNSSQQGTSTTPKQLNHHGLLLSAHNVSSTQLDTPRQVAASSPISNNFLFQSSNNLPAVRNSLNVPQISIQDYQNNNKNTQVNQNNQPQLLQQTQENNKNSETNFYPQQLSSQASLPQHQKYNSPSLPLGIQVDCQFSPLNRAQVGTSTKSKDGQHHSKNQGLSPIVNSQERSDFISNSILDDIPSAYSQQLNSSLVIQTSSSQNFNQFQQHHPFLIHNSQQLNIYFSNND